MPIKPTRLSCRRLPLTALLFALGTAAHAQTDDAAPFYAGASVGVSHVSNVYRVGTASSVPTGATNSDNVT